MGERLPIEALFRETFDFLPRFGYEFVRPEGWFSGGAIGATQFVAVMHEERDALVLVFLGRLSGRAIPDYSESLDIFDIDDVRQALSVTAPPLPHFAPQDPQSILADSAEFLRKYGVPELEGELLEELRGVVRSREARRWDL